MNSIRERGMFCRSLGRMDYRILLGNERFLADDVFVPRSGSIFYRPSFCQRFRPDLSRTDLRLTRSSAHVRSFWSADILVGRGLTWGQGRQECRRSCAWESAHTEGCKSLPGGASRQTTERNCVLAIRAWRATGSERIVRRTAGVKTTATRTRYGLMRLTRLRAMSEVRSTAASPPGEAGAKPVQNAKHRRNRGAWGGWRRNVRKCVCLNRGDLSWCWKEQGRSQSPHSSRETGNDRGAKGGRKVEA